VIICRGCRSSFVSSRAPVADLCTECYERSRMPRLSAAVPADGRNAGVARPLRSSTGYRLNGGLRGQLDLDAGVDLSGRRR
jgi:hypothetical protein